jgi:16S rRNA (guanine(1405)-N(7))-methyltransferase
MVDPEAVAAEVLRSRRYRWVDPALVARLAATSLPGARNAADAVKRTKRRLHQVSGAYVLDVDPRAALAQLRGTRSQTNEGTDERTDEGSSERTDEGSDKGSSGEVAGGAGAGDAARRAVTLAILAGHASTRERLPVLDRFYGEVFAHTGLPHVVLDVACGLNPLTWPWMGLPSSTTYLAFDVDRRLVDLVDGYLDLCAVPHVATLQDVAAAPPTQRADVGFVLKTAPCLEQQAPGSTRRLLDALDVSFVVLSYPTRSLGGVGKGMVAHYRAQLDAAIAGADWALAATIPFPAETVYVLSRPAPGKLSPYPTVPAASPPGTTVIGRGR